MEPSKKRWFRIYGSVAITAVCAITVAMAMAQQGLTPVVAMYLLVGLIALRMVFVIFR